MRKRHIALLGLVGLLFLIALMGVVTGVWPLTLLALSAVGVLGLLWLAIALFRRLLWGVGRKLAFSYFLIGVLPIPMVMLLVGVTSYLLFGALVGHLFRDTLVLLHREVEETATERLRAFAGQRETPETQGDLALAYYRDGVRVAGDPEAPEEWPAWLVEPETAERAGLAQQVPFVVFPEGEVRMAAAVETGGMGVLATFQSDLEQELRERSGIWVQVEPWAAAGGIQVGVGESGPSLVFRRGRASQLREEFFGVTGRELRWRERPVLFWVALLSSARPLEAPDRTVRLGALLNATPETIHQQVVAGAAEVDAMVWGILVVLAFLLFDIYVVAALMALFMIFGLSRAVNRLHKATSAVQKGDFSVRIPVKRRDQVGELQRSFNDMAANLEMLVATSAQKESLEKELQIARELQQTLLPSSLTTTEAVEMASYFEPSAAIGGDYFDLLRLEGGRLAVVIADVSGHGLSAGLRMAMLKAALVMLMEQGLAPGQILARLDRMIRADESGVSGRPMVTATISIFDPSTGHLELTNAGHSPAYRLFRPEPGAAPSSAHRPADPGADTEGAEGAALEQVTVAPGAALDIAPLEVEEIVLPSPPLGALGGDYLSRSLELQPGELAVWLSDGLIEASNVEGEPFGYDRVVESLRGPAASAAQVRDRLLAAVARHCGIAPPDDDRTLVVMRYLPAAG